MMIYESISTLYQVWEVQAHHMFQYAALSIDDQLSLLLQNV